MNEKFQKLGFYPADILLPKDADMTKWAVVACDQFTSQPEYWQAVEETVGDAPSTLRLILPEAKLNDPDVDTHIADINGAMNRYLAEGVFQTLPGSLFYIERTQSDGKVRHGLIGMVDLDQYDFTPGSGALIRATEGTVLSRIPPRVRVRQDAPVELPHVMLLIDDPDRTVIEPLTAASGEMEQLYDFDLQQGGGHLKGWKLTDAQMDAVADALAAMCTPEAMEKKYGLKDAAPLLFAVGDGNHSLATAKQCYENLKKVTPEDQWAGLPARYALRRGARTGAGGDEGRLSRRPRRGGRGPHHRLHLCRAYRYHHGAQSQDAAGGGHAPDLPGRLSQGARRRSGLHPWRRSDGRVGQQVRQHRLQAPGYGQGTAVQDRHGRRRPAPQDLLHGPRPG